MRGQEGQGLVEYGLLLVLVSVAVIGALLAVRGQLGVVFGGITTALQNA
jgi:pilus assembly protein Flp/PilA